MTKVLSPTLSVLFKNPKKHLGLSLRLQGWIRNKRQSSGVLFLVLSDGSTQSTLQAVAEPSSYASSLLQKLSVGASVSLEGKLIATPSSPQPYELRLSNITLLGTSDPEKYPLQPKSHSYAFLRSCAHLRPRTATFGAVFRVRHVASYAIHRFFYEKEFFYVHTPIISSADAEGAGEMFSIRTSDLPDTTNFFGQEAHLTVSGQLEAELLAMGLSRVYTFGPTFRAENSNTTRHLAEFWMVEPEVAFYDLKDCMKLAEQLLKFVIKEVVEKCSEELTFLEQQQTKHQQKLPSVDRAKPLSELLNQLSSSEIPQISYEEAFHLLERSKPNRKGKFIYPIQKWGQELQAEHERYLVQHFSGALFVRDYPVAQKAFYMRLNDDNKTVAAMDLLLPQVGELIGGSEREERLEKLEERMKSYDIQSEKLEWYLDTRRYGSVAHSGFGLGFDRLVQLLTGMENIRDVIPFPRSPGQLNF